MVTGWNEPVTRTAARGLGIVHDGANTPISALQAHAPERALIYGVASHAIDYDDTGLAGHPSAILVPTILAEAAESGANGRQMIAAYVGGYELWAEMTRREPDQHHRKGWHPTAMLGTIAAAGAVSVLRGHDAAMATRTIGVAASLAGGIVGNFGSMTKPYQVGRAAQSGLLAARLAEAGLTSTETAIEDDLGFLRAISPKGAVDTESPSAFGKEWGILKSGINIKLYPVCYAIHRALDAVIDMRAKTPVKADDVEAIDLEIGETQAEILRVHRPTNGLDAEDLRRIRDGLGDRRRRLRPFRTDRCLRQPARRAGPDRQGANPHHAGKGRPRAGAFAVRSRVADTAKTAASSRPRR